MYIVSYIYLTIINFSMTDPSLSAQSITNKKMVLQMKHKNRIKTQKVYDQISAIVNTATSEQKIVDPETLSQNALAFLPQHQRGSFLNKTAAYQRKEQLRQKLLEKLAVKKAKQ